MEHFVLTRNLREVGHFPTDHHEQLLGRLQEALKREGKIQAIQSLAVNKHRVTLDTLYGHPCP